MYKGKWFKDIKRVIRNKFYDPDKNSPTFAVNDFAILELLDPIEPKYVKPACLPNPVYEAKYYGALLVSLEKLFGWLFR